MKGESVNTQKTNPGESPSGCHGNGDESDGATRIQRGHDSQIVS